MTTAASPSAVRWCLCGVEAPASFASRLLRARVQSTVMLLPVGPLHHGTPKRDSVGTVLQRYSRLCANNRQGERAIHPPTKDRGLSGPCSVRPDAATASSRKEDDQSAQATRCFDPSPVLCIRGSTYSGRRGSRAT